jgi:hypothetical protein
MIFVAVTATEIRRRSTVKTLKEQVAAYLNKVAVEKGLAVHEAGVIDASSLSTSISGTRPLRATWKADPIRTASDHRDQK